VSRLPSLKARDVIAALQRAGWEVDHVSGSHYILRHPLSGKRMPVPFHANRDLKRAVLHSIIKQSGLTVAEFRSLL
jgi:predicted RNA binding protein YcfA (HicA-like mRNA interferase family)